MNLNELKHVIQFPNMTGRQLAVVAFLYQSKNKKVRLKDLAIELQMPKPSMCRAWDALWEIKFLQRERNCDDNREVFGYLTEKGLKFAAKIMR